MSNEERTSVKKEMVDILLGVDFGTSATKLVARAPFVAGSPAGVVPAPRGARAEGSRSLWSSVIWYQPSSGCFSLIQVGGAVRISGMKAAFVDGPKGDSAQGPAMRELVAAYLALVMREAAQWLMANGHSILRDHKPVWSVNFGIPAATYDSPLFDDYRLAACAAWRMSQENKPVSLSGVRDHLAACSQSKPTDGLDGHLGVIPEIAAAVAGFARSTSRRDGLYVLVDVGAATLDACCFRLGSPTTGIDRYSMFVADVQPLGVEAFNALIEKGETEEDLERKAAQMVKRVIWNTKLDRDPTAPEWHDRLPLFLCGGGSTNASHRRAMEALSDWLAAYSDGASVPIIALDPPEQLEGLNEEAAYHRMAVAWGLGYPEVEIGELQRPSDIEDMPRSVYRDISESFVSKDQM